MKKLILLALLIVLGFYACKKEISNLSSELNSVERIENDPLFYKWAQAANGRWVPYSLEKIDRSKLDTENNLQMWDAAAVRIYNARKHYEALLVTKYGEGIPDFTNHLYILYKRNYEKINLSLKERKIMDSLYSVYANIDSPVPDIRMMSGSRISNWTDLNEVEVRTCQIPQSLLNFYRIFFMNPFPPYYPPGQPKTCQQLKLEKVGEAISMMRYTFQQTDPGGWDCTYWKQNAYDAMREYYSCDLIDTFPGESPDDPYAPGNGGGGPGTPMPEPEYEVFKIKTDSLDAKYPCVKKTILNPL